jgi:hypothetical protein
MKTARAASFGHADVVNALREEMKTSNAATSTAVEERNAVQLALVVATDRIAAFEGGEATSNGAGLKVATERAAALEHEVEQLRAQLSVDANKTAEDALRREVVLLTVTPPPPAAEEVHEGEQTRRIALLIEELAESKENYKQLEGRCTQLKEEGEKREAAATSESDAAACKEAETAAESERLRLQGDANEVERLRLQREVSRLSAQLLETASDSSKFEGYVVLKKQNAALLMQVEALSQTSKKFTHNGRKISLPGGGRGGDHRGRRR